MNVLTIYFIVAVVLLFFVGIYSLLVSRNLIRVLIAVEILTKAATLMLILAGYMLDNQNSAANAAVHTAYYSSLAQAFVITLIIIEVVVIAVAAGIVIGIFRHNDTLDTRKISNLKG